MSITQLPHPPSTYPPATLSMPLKGQTIGLSPCMISFLSVFPPSPMILCAVSYIPHMGESIRLLSFSDWLISFSIIPSSSIPVNVNGKYSTVLMVNIPLHKYTTLSLSTHLSVDISALSTGWLLWTLLLWTLGVIAVLLQVNTFVSLRQIPRRAIAGS